MKQRKKKILLLLLSLFIYVGCAQNSKLSSFSLFREATLRAPAQTSDCSHLLNETLLFFRPPPGFHFWKRLTQSNFGLNDFSIERMQVLEGDYLSSLKVGPKNLEPEASAEGLMAFARATSSHAGMDPTELRHVSLKQTKALNSVLKKLSFQKRLSLDDIESLTLELFNAAFGPKTRPKGFFSFSERQKELILELSAADIARSGLFSSFSHFRFIQGNPSLFRRFSNSRFASGLKVSLFNLPMLLGAPPLYLPKFKAPKLSRELSDELLRKGMTDELYERIQKEIGSRLIARDKYQEIRKYYMYGVMIYLVLAQAYETYQLDAELEETRGVLKEASDEALEITGSIEVLEKAGIDVFSDELIEDGNIFCQNLIECFEAFGVSKVDTESEGFATCQDVIDPGNQCTSL